MKNLWSFRTTIQIADPSYTVWSGVSSYHSESVKTFTEKFLKAYGIVW